MFASREHSTSGERRYTDVDGRERRAAICIGPEYGTVGPELVKEAAKEAVRGVGFDLLIICGFSFDPHVSEETKRYGKLTVLATRMIPDLAMGDELLKKTGAGNLFMVFGEPDIEVTSDQWLVTRSGRSIIPLHEFEELSGIGGLAEINRLGGKDLQFFKDFPSRREVRVDQPASAIGGLSAVQHRRGGRAVGDRRVSPVSRSGAGIAGRGGDTSDSGDQPRDPFAGSITRPSGRGAGDRSHAQRLDQIAEVQSLSADDLPLTTGHLTQVTIFGLDVYDPTSGEIRQSSTDDIACWFIDTDYNGESFFVRHAYFTGTHEPYEKLKKALKAEIDEAAWSQLYSTRSRPFDKPSTGKIAVKVINHYGDEVLKVYAIGKA